MDRCRYRGAVKRVCLRALDETSIRKALADIRPGDETVPCITRPWPAPGQTG